MTAQNLLALLQDQTPYVGEVDMPKFKADDLGVDRLFIACHPDGAARGGFVVWAEKSGQQVYYNEGEWKTM